MSSLMTSSYEIIQSAKISMSFDDGISKIVLVSPGDIVNVIYNYNGVRTNTTGKVSKIVPDNQNSCECSGKRWFLIIDASAYGGVTVNRIDLTKILDITIIRKAEDYSEVTSPTGETNVSNIRLVGNVLQISVNNGTSWLDACTLPAIEDGISQDDAAYVARVKAILPDSLRPDVYNTLLKNMVAMLKNAEEN